jgi:hypothetical protein
MDTSNHDDETIDEGLFIPCNDEDSDYDFELEDSKFVVRKNLNQLTVLFITALKRRI